MKRLSPIPLRNPNRLLLLAWIVLGARAGEAVTSEAGVVEPAVALETFNALPALRERGIRATEFQAVKGLYLLNGLRTGPEGKVAPVSLAISGDLRYTYKQLVGELWGGEHP